MSYPLLIIFGILPSAIWLLFYLRKDVHPESNRMIIKIFFYGMISAFLTIFLELGAQNLFGKFELPDFCLSFLNIFLGTALIEELMKFLVVKKKVFNSHEFDEPIDIMLYMIISALGFAASENLLVLLNERVNLLFVDVLGISIFRFLGATFLHALCSGVFGYFLALGFFESKKRKKLISLGLLISVLLHGFFNISIMRLEDAVKVTGELIVVDYHLLIGSILTLFIILFGLAISLFFSFKKLEKMKSICKII